ncbi:MAG: cell wall hydrolase [Rhodospirillales bacterium]|nr:cell wall hydrolase [Rhodospirillales bacterium]
MKATGKGRLALIEGPALLVAWLLLGGAATDTMLQEDLRTSALGAGSETLLWMDRLSYLADSNVFDSAVPASEAIADLPGTRFVEAPGYPKAVEIPVWAPTSGDLDEELRCLALNIYFEARGESDAGRSAVGHVVMNRVSDRRFPATVCAVVQQGGEMVRHRCQFSWWCDGRSDRPLDRRSWEAAGTIARAVYWGLSEDPTQGALWYHADYVAPYWSKAFEEGPTIGRHVFYLERGHPIQLAHR